MSMGLECMSFHIYVVVVGARIHTFDILSHSLQFMFREFRVRDLQDQEGEIKIKHDPWNILPRTMI